MKAWPLTIDVFCQGPPARTSQSPPVHQFSVEGIFTRADAQKIERLLDKPIADFGVLAQFLTG